MLERTIYYYTQDTAYTSATEAYERSYAGYARVENKDNKNYSQDSNTDIWIYPARYEGDPKFSEYIYPSNSVMELKGKLYFPETGRYRIYMRGRIDAALYLSRDGGKTYSLAARIDRNEGLGLGAGFYPNSENTYCDIDVTAEDWVYFKEVLIVEPAGSNMSFVGLGLGAWGVPMYTAEVRYYANINGTKTELTQETAGGATKYYYNQNGNKTYVDNNTVNTETVYKNSRGEIVSAEEAANTNPVPPQGNPTYVTAYRQSYEFQRQFESDYFYTKTHTFSYSNAAKPSDDACIVDFKNVEAWGDSPVENLLHESGKFQAKSYTLPFEITVDMGHEVTANRLDLLGTLANGMSYHPTKFYVLVGTEEDDITTPFGQHWENVQSNNGNTGFTIDEAITFRYYKIVVEGWSFGAPQFRHIKFSYVIAGTAAKYSPDDGRFTYGGSWLIAQTSSSFGHVYLGYAGAEVSFELEAASDSSRLGIISSDKYGRSYEVYIDGVKVNTENLPEDSNETTLRYLSSMLSQGTHRVTIRCTGEANIDSIVVYP